MLGLVAVALPHDPAFHFSATPINFRHLDSLRRAVRRRDSEHVDRVRLRHPANDQPEEQ